MNAPHRHGTAHLPLAVALAALLSGAFLVVDEAGRKSDRITTPESAIRCEAERLKGTEPDTSRHVQAPTRQPSI